MLFDWSQEGSDTGETLMCGVDQHHRYPMVSPGCRLVDMRVNVEGAGSWERIDNRFARTEFGQTAIETAVAVRSPIRTSCHLDLARRVCVLAGRCVGEQRVT